MRYKHGIRDYNKWHESFHDRGPGYLSAGLAVWEHLSESERRDLQNYWENTRGAISEMCPQGGITNGYDYCQPYYTMTVLLWDYASNWDAEIDPVRDYLTGEIKYFLHRMNADATRWYQTHSDNRTHQDFANDGYFVEPFQAYAVAHRLNWGLGQWVANRTRAGLHGAFGSSDSRAKWVALLLSDRRLTETSPQDALPLTELYSQQGGSGNVTMRSAWTFSGEVSIGLFSQCFYEHDNNHFGHFDVRRGDELLAVRSTARTRRQSRLLERAHVELVVHPQLHGVLSSRRRRNRVCLARRRHSGQTGTRPALL